MRDDEAAASLKKFGLLAEVRRDFSDGVEEGKVFDTIPRSGKEIREGKTVVLYVSQGSQPASPSRKATRSRGNFSKTPPQRKSVTASIIDIGLPKLDGLSVIMTLRSYAKTRRMPLVTLSAMTGEKARAAAIDAGADMALEKPCTPEEVELIVNTLIHR